MANIDTSGLPGREVLRKLISYDPETRTAARGSCNAKYAGKQTFRHNEALIDALLALSESDDWAEAQREWRFAAAWYEEEWDNCLCGTEIKERCEIQNVRNHNQAIVGNVCINRFLSGVADVPADIDNLFAGIRRIVSSLDAAPNHAVIRYARERGWINNWEGSFLLSTAAKRKLSMKQAAKRRDINERLVRRFSREG